MPKLRYHHAPHVKGARENDIGHLIDIARSAGLYVRRPGPGMVELQATRSRHILFTGSVVQAVTFLKNR